MSSLGWTTLIDGKDTSNSVFSFSSIDTYDGYDAAREHVHIAVHWPPVGCEQGGEVFKAGINLGICAGELAGTLTCCLAAWAVRFGSSGITQAHQQYSLAAHR